MLHLTNFIKLYKRAEKMNKSAIKIIKRFEEDVTEKIAIAPQVLGSRAKAEDITERRMAGVVAVWVSECRENKRAEEVTALNNISAWKNNSEILQQSSFNLTS